MTTCFYSEAGRAIIDIVRPDTGLGLYGGKTLEGIRSQYPDAVVLPTSVATEKLDDLFVSKVLTEITEQQFFYALEVLPPVGRTNRDGVESFKMSERLSGMITSIYVSSCARFFTFDDRITLSHEAIADKLRLHLAAAA